MSASLTPDHAEWDYCVMCHVWDITWRGQCPACFRLAHMQIARRTWRQEVKRDWVLTIQPWLVAQYASAADPRHWPAPLALMAIVVLVGREWGRLP